MAAQTQGQVGFVPMPSIKKKTHREAQKCSQWVATEKIHGSSFQMYTGDGVNVRIAGRRKTLDDAESYVLCDVRELLGKYKEYVLKMWCIIRCEDKWELYRETSTVYDDIAPELIDNVDAEDDEKVEDSSKSWNDNEEVESLGSATSYGGNDLSKTCSVRIYGELYGGGGIRLPVESAAQKEIIYCDEFRFCVFGLTINRRWVNIYELNDLCREAGFPYYTKPVCEPMDTVDEVKEHLTKVGFMASRSAFTEKEGDDKTLVEGVVISPLQRPDFAIHSIKFLAPAFLDVKVYSVDNINTTNFCTKQRYHSVISKLDIPERKDTKLVANMFVQDIIDEGEYGRSLERRMKIRWAKIVIEWLREDGYNPDESILETIGTRGAKRQMIYKTPKEIIRNTEEDEQKREERKIQKQKRQTMEYDDDEYLPMDLFDL